MLMFLQTGFMFFMLDQIYFLLFLFIYDYCLGNCIADMNSCIRVSQETDPKINRKLCLIDMKMMFIHTGFIFFNAGYNYFFCQSDTITVWKIAPRYRLIVMKKTNRPHVLYAEYYYIILFFIQCN